MPFVVAFLVAIITAFSYLELVTKYPQAAGAALYTRKASGIHFVTFIVAFTVMSSGITSASTASRAFASNLGAAFDLNLGDGIKITLVALAFITLVAIVNFRGVSESVRANVALTCVELSGLLLIIFIGVWTLGGGDGNFSQVTQIELPQGQGLFGAVTAGNRRLDLEGPLHWPCRDADDPGEGRLYQHGFATPNGPAQLAARPWLPPGEQPDAEYPYTLVTGRGLTHYNAGTMTRRTADLVLAPSEHVDVSPEDAARFGVGDGDRVEIASRRGTVRAAVRVTEDMAPGELFMAFHFPQVAANLLTSDGTDEVTACPEYKVTAVRMSRASHR